MTLEAVFTAAKAAAQSREPKSLPALKSDFFAPYETLSAEEPATVKGVPFQNAKVAPVVTKYWLDDAFPFEPPLRVA